MECFEIMFFPFVLVVTSVPCVWGTLLRAWPAGDGAAHEGQKDTLLAVVRRHFPTNLLALTNVFFRGPETLYSTV